MSSSVHASREQLGNLTIETLKGQVEKDAWVALKLFLSGFGNIVEAKISAIVLNVIVKEMQAKNNARSLDIISKRLGLKGK